MDIQEENERQNKQMQKNFKFLREQRNWSIQKLSEISGIGEKNLTGIETGKDFGMLYLFKLCRIYDLKPHEVFSPLESGIPEPAHAKAKEPPLR